MAFTIYRIFTRGGKEEIKSYCTLEEAQEHCEDPQTDSRTCTGLELVQYTNEKGPWYDAYNEVRDYMLTEEWQIGRRR